MSDKKPQKPELAFIDHLVARGKHHFSHADAVAWTGRSASATSNLLRRMVELGLVDRIRRGHYVVREFGVLGTRAAAESVVLTVGAAFAGQPHRIAYRSALDLLDLITHPSRTIQVAATKQMRVESLSGRRLRVILEPEEFIGVGATPNGPSMVSDMSRALLDAASRPQLVGGAAVLAEAVVSAGAKADVTQMTAYAEILNRPAAIRRLGSIADALELGHVAGAFRPLKAPVADILLEPGIDDATVWRDSRWRVQWSQSPDELRHVVHQ